MDAISTDPATSGELHHPVSENDDVEAQVENLMTENRGLVHEIGTLRSLTDEDNHRSSRLEKELQTSSTRAESLSARIASLEEEKRSAEDKAGDMVREVEALHADKTALQAEIRTISTETRALNATLTETEEKYALLVKDLEEKQAAMESLRNQIHMTCFEIKKLQADQEEYSKEVSSLSHANNGATTAIIGQLKEKEKVLSGKMEQTLSDKALAEQKLSHAQASISDLFEEISVTKATSNDIQNQLLEALSKLMLLEEQNKVMTANEMRMETRIADIKSELHSLKEDHESMLHASKQEQEGRAAHAMELAAGGRDFYVMGSSMEVKETDEDTSEQQAEDLASQIANMHDKSQDLTSAIEYLKDALRRQRSAQEELETEELNPLRDDIKSIEGTLEEVEQRDRVLKEKETQLSCRLHELCVSTKQTPGMGGWMKPLVLSSGAVVALGVLVYFLAKSKSRKFWS